MGLATSVRLCGKKLAKNVKLKIVGRRRGWLEKRLGVRNEWADDLIEAVQTRALWTRYGL